MIQAMQGFWLLSDSFFESAVEAFERFEFDHAAYEIFIEAQKSRPEGAELFRLEDGAARIPVVGVLTKQPDFFLSIFGPGSAVYGDLIAAVQAAEASDSVDRIILEIDSPGGEAAGFFETAQAIAATTKPTEAHVTDRAASGAFGLAAMADSISVNNPMALVGSVGVAVQVRVSENVVKIASTEAPNKRPDPTTEEGVAAIRVELDALHAQFAGVIATGRGISVDKVNADFGRGGMVIAEKALQAGMIDGIDSSTVQAPSSSKTTLENDSMTREEFRIQFPAEFAAIWEEALEAGVAQERDRVVAHVEAGQNVGDGGAELANELILSGENFSSQKVIARYLTAGRNSSDLSNRAGDDDDADTGGDTGSADGGDAPDVDAECNAVFDELEANLGLGSSAGA